MPGPESTGGAALGGPIDERTPLYTRLAALAAEHPGAPLPNHGEDVLDPRTERPAPIGPVEPDSEHTRARAWAVPRLRRSLRWFLTESPRDRDALRLLYPELVAAGDADAQAAAAAIGPPGPVRALGRWLCRHAADRDAVELGLHLLAETAPPASESPETAADVELLGTLALAENDFTAAAVRALTRTLPDHKPAVFAVAKRVRDRGLGPVVAALAHTTDPAVKRWMIRDVTGIELMFCCDIVATSGDLLGALRDDPDDELLDNAGDVLWNLCDPGVQTRDITHYPDARAALAEHRRLLAERERTLTRLWHLTELETSVRTTAASALDWDPGERESLLDDYGTLLADPAWTAVVADELGHPQSRRRYFASRCAGRVGFDILGWMLAGLDSDAPDDGLDWDVPADCEPERLPEVAAALRRALRQPSGEDYWTAGHKLLYALLPRLVDAPDLGEDLIEYALARENTPLGGKARQLLRRRGETA